MRGRLLCVCKQVPVQHPSWQCRDLTMRHLRKANALCRDGWCVLHGLVSHLAAGLKVDVLTPYVRH